MNSAALGERTMTRELHVHDHYSGLIAILFVRSMGRSRLSISTVLPAWVSSAVLPRPPPVLAPMRKCRGGTADPSGLGHPLPLAMLSLTQSSPSGEASPPRQKLCRIMDRPRRAPTGAAAMRISSDVLTVSSSHFVPLDHIGRIEIRSAAALRLFIPRLILAARNSGLLQQLCSLWHPPA